MSDPAIAILEFDSVSAGIVAGDAMVKASPLGSIYAGSVHPGNYLVLVSGDTASVEIAVETGSRAGNMVDHVFLPDVHPDLVTGLIGNRPAAHLKGESVGIVETRDVASIVDAADAGLKAADVSLAGIRIADGLGGKGYLLFSGVVAEVEAAIEAALGRVDGHGSLVRSDVIPQIHSEMAQNLQDDLGFLNRIETR